MSVSFILHLKFACVGREKKQKEKDEEDKEDDDDDEEEESEEEDEDEEDDRGLYKPYEQYLASIIAFPLKSLRSLTLAGLEEMDYMSRFGIHKKFGPRFPYTVPYPVLTTLGIHGNIAVDHSYEIMNSIRSSAPLNTFSLERVEARFLDGVPPPMESMITRLVLDQRTAIVPSTIPKFVKLQTLEWSIYGLCGVKSHDARLFGYNLRQLEVLKLHGPYDKFFQWTQNCLSEPHYMPKLKSLSMHVRILKEAPQEWQAALKALVASVAPSRRIACDVNFEGEEPEERPVKVVVIM